MKFFQSLIAALATLLLAVKHNVAEFVRVRFYGVMIAHGLISCACDELNAFAIATESLDQRIRRMSSAERARQGFWYNAIPRGTFVKNQGVERTTYTVKPSEPSDDPDLWTDVTLDDDTGQPTPACDTNYEDITVGFYPRTYNPKKRRLRGPVLCKENFTYQHSIDQFLDAYVGSMTGYVMRAWEFTLRRDYMTFGNVWTDGNMTEGPNALANAPCPTSDITQGQLDLVADHLQDVGAGVTDEMGFVMQSDEGPMFTLYIGRTASARILTNNDNRRDDARWAFPNELWKAIGAKRVIGNFRHMPTGIPPRANCVDGVLVEVSPFRNVAAITSNGETLSAEYKAAEYEAAIVVVPATYTAEVVLPANWQFPDAGNYTGELQFITGGERICNPAVYDPQHEKGRHFGKIVYAPAPNMPYYAQTLWFRRCAGDDVFAYCP